LLGNDFGLGFNSLQQRNCFALCHPHFSHIDSIETIDFTRMPSAHSKDLDRFSQQKIARRQLSPLLIGCGVGALLLGAIWYSQQASIKHLGWKIQQLRQATTKLSSATPPAVRLDLQREEISLEAERVHLQNSLYNILVQGLGIAGLGVLGYQYTRRQQRDRHEVERDRATDLLDRAVANLASDKLEIRLGGIYTIERIAQESPTQAWTAIELLAAFVRAKSYAQREQIRAQQRINQRQIAFPRIPTDVQAAISAIGRRDLTFDREDRAIELRETNLRAADLVGAQLLRADLWRTNLSDAQLWQAQLTGAFLGRANLNNASLWQANLTGAYLWQANLQDTNFDEANLSGANLSGANLKGANLKGANLQGADLRAVTELTKEQLDLAIVDEDTQLPDYLSRLSNI
jgi:hypothetical protein